MSQPRSCRAVKPRNRSTSAATGNSAVIDSLPAMRPTSAARTLIGQSTKGHAGALTKVLRIVLVAGDPSSHRPWGAARHRDPQTGRTPAPSYQSSADRPWFPILHPSLKQFPGQAANPHRQGGVDRTKGCCRKNLGRLDDLANENRPYQGRQRNRPPFRYEESGQQNRGDHVLPPSWEHHPIYSAGSSVIRTARRRLETDHPMEVGEAALTSNAEGLPTHGGGRSRPPMQRRRRCCGGGGIRTHGTLTGPQHFECCALGRTMRPLRVSRHGNWLPAIANRAGRYDFAVC